MRARAPRQVTINSTPTLISDTTKPPPVTRVLYYASGGNSIALGGSGVSYATGFPMGAGKPDFNDPDQSYERYAITNTGTQTLYIQEYED